ncbi:DUF885 family protein [Legionella sp. W05-934-2]|uniref:DUF885 domain-containing protein n=1 Tax=Legionella sp. W05-934-2 TaxID=1198649 RepID=UPI003462AF71
MLRTRLLAGGLLFSALAIAGGYWIVHNHSTETFMNIASDYQAALLNAWPETGLFEGKTDVSLDRFADYSETGYQKWRELENHFLARLNRIDPKTLEGTPQWITYQQLKASLENSIDTRVCKRELWEVSPIAGWHNMMVELAEIQPVDTLKHRQQALKRWSQFDELSAQQLANLKQGLEQGYTAPKPAVQRVIAQLKLMTEGNATNSPFATMAKRANDPQFESKMLYLIKNKINPELQKHITFLEQEYLPNARESIGVSALPNGQACYRARIKQETTLAMSPQKIHQIGLVHMKKLAQEVAKIGAARYNVEDMSIVFSRAKKDTIGEFADEQSILAYTNHALEKVKAAAPKWFDKMPKSRGEVHPYPLHRAKTGAPGEYSPPSEDGLKPGIYYMNTYQPVKHSRIDDEATLYHELIPGHHFQIALQAEDKTQLELNKFLRNSGYCEGWGLYAERLADEMGLYEDDISRLGMLSNEAMRASRLVVDTGIHAFGWTRQQAVDYMKAHTAVDDDIIEGEVDRYIMLPGQANAYMLGKRAIESLRAEAQKQLGADFDIREFHNQVLKHGAVTLPMLAAQIHHWLDDKKQKQKT